MTNPITTGVEKVGKRHRARVLRVTASERASHACLPAQESLDLGRWPSHAEAARAVLWGCHVLKRYGEVAANYTGPLTTHDKVLLSGVPLAGLAQALQQVAKREEPLPDLAAVVEAAKPPVSVAGSNTLVSPRPRGNAAPSVSSANAAASAMHAHRALFSGGGAVNGPRSSSLAHSPLAAARGTRGVHSALSPLPNNSTAVSGRDDAGPSPGPSQGPGPSMSQPRPSPRRRRAPPSPSPSEEGSGASGSPRPHSQLHCPRRTSTVHLMLGIVGAAAGCTHTTPATSTLPSSSHASHAVTSRPVSLTLDAAAAALAAATAAEVALNAAARSTSVLVQAAQGAREAQEDHEGINALAEHLARVEVGAIWVEEGLKAALASLEGQGGRQGQRGAGEEGAVGEQRGAAMEE